jgi:hypothetical protein
MVAQFPEVVSAPAAFLVPKINFSIVSKDLFSSGLDGINKKKCRTAEIKIQALSINKNLMLSTVTRLFDHIYNTIVNDINPDIVTANNTTHSESDYYPTSASVSLNVNVDKTNNPRFVDFHLEIIDLKAQYIDDTFSRIKTYLVNAVENDMNPDN